MCGPVYDRVALNDFVKILLTGAQPKTDEAQIKTCTTLHVAKDLVDT